MAINYLSLHPVITIMAFLKVNTIQNTDSCLYPSHIMAMAMVVLELEVEAHTSGPLTSTCKTTHYCGVCAIRQLASTQDLVVF